MNDENNGNVFISFFEKHKFTFCISSFIVLLLIYGVFFGLHNKCSADTIKSFKYSTRDISIKQLKECELFNIVLLNNGNFLISGGINNNYTTDRAYIYNLQKNSIEKELKMNQARCAHQSLLLSNGNVLILGGYYNSKFVKEIEVYDDLKKEFYTVTTTKFSPKYIVETVNPNQVLLFSNLANIQLLNIKQKTVSRINTLENKQEIGKYSYIAKVKDDLIFFPYSFSDTKSYDKSIIYKFNLKTYKIEMININIYSKEIEFTVNPININDNEILFFGISNWIYPTSNIISYDTKTNNANVIAQLSTPRSHCHILSIDKDNILIIGGYKGVFKDTKLLNSSEVYNIKKQKIVAINSSSFNFNKPYESLTLPGGRFLAKPYEFIKIQDNKYLIYSKNKIQLFEIIKK